MEQGQRQSGETELEFILNSVLFQPSIQTTKSHKPAYSKIYHYLFFSLNNTQLNVKGLYHVTDYILSLPILWVRGPQPPHSLQTDSGLLGTSPHSRK